MKTIASFTIDHMALLPGIYVSRQDQLAAEAGGKVMLTTFDIRMTRPNFEPVMNTAEMHTIEHLGATFLRNHPVYGPQVVYFGPMGCRTGFYLILAGDLSAEEVAPLVKEMMIFIRDYEGTVPGASAEQCGNYLDMNLNMAKYCAKRFLSEVMEQLGPERLHYPETNM